MNQSYIEFLDVSRYFYVGDSEIKAVDKASFTIEKGSFTVIVGPSGAGKTTILNLLGGMDKVSDGRLFVDNNNIAPYNEMKLNTYRRDDIGFVFQFYNLVNNLTTLENVELATQICKDALVPQEVLNDVGLSHRLDSFPSQLSGGEQQRVAIARALAKNPKLLLCDEPTGALDTTTGQQILSLLQNASRQYNMTVVVITHNRSIAQMADHVISIRNGSVADNYYNENPLSANEIEW
ncbi:MAG: ABC transporter ATP-binding protein [Erysipelothrix sp.]|nr:ABC transporter ATP-binding protein [Erysipelothrix sp.]